MFVQMSVGIPVLLTSYGRSPAMRFGKTRLPAGVGTDRASGDEQFKILATAGWTLRGG